MVSGELMMTNRNAYSETDRRGRHEWSKISGLAPVGNVACAGHSSNIWPSIHRTIS
jgi:hypothetical protein